MACGADSIGQSRLVEHPAQLLDQQLAVGVEGDAQAGVLPVLDEALGHAGLAASSRRREGDQTLAGVDGGEGVVDALDLMGPILVHFLPSVSDLCQWVNLS